MYIVLRPGDKVNNGIGEGNSVTLCVSMLRTGAVR